MPSERAVSSKSPMEKRLLAVGSWLLVDIAVPDSSASLCTREKLLTAESAEVAEFAGKSKPQRGKTAKFERSSWQPQSRAFLLALRPFPIKGSCGSRFFLGVLGDLCG